MSNIIDAYCVYCCAQEIKNHTEETKDMTSKKAYINRKRYIYYKHHKAPLVDYYKYKLNLHNTDVTG